MRIQCMCNIMCNIVWENTILRNTRFFSHIIFRFFFFFFGGNFLSLGDTKKWGLKILHMVFFWGEK
jgi:hypothetical protein